MLWRAPGERRLYVLAFMSCWWMAAPLSSAALLGGSLSPPEPINVQIGAPPHPRTMDDIVRTSSVDVPAMMQPRVSRMLILTADTTAGVGGTAARDASKKNQVLFATPASGGYIPITGTVLGAGVEFLLIRPLYRRHIEQVLVTVGLGLVMVALITGIWGADPRPSRARDGRLAAPR